jgi:hypothetical protein
LYTIKQPAKYILSGRNGANTIVGKQVNVASQTYYNFQTADPHPCKPAPVKKYLLQVG